MRTIIEYADSTMTAEYEGGAPCIEFEEGAHRASAVTIIDGDCVCITEPLPLKFVKRVIFEV